jgi:hypothetical protein
MVFRARRPGLLSRCAVAAIDEMSHTTVRCDDDHA